MNYEDAKGIIDAHGKRLPRINMQTLRKVVRYMVIEYIVDQLGFDVVQWNRR